MSYIFRHNCIVHSELSVNLNLIINSLPRAVLMFPYVGKAHNPLHEVFIKAGQEAGYPYTEDVNGYQQEGVGPFEMTIHKGKRWSTSQGYLRPALNRYSATLSVFRSYPLSSTVCYLGGKEQCTYQPTYSRIHIIK